eukprot:scaffold123288_cov31-Tisochrysis_lutea.AAC.1
MVNLSSPIEKREGEDASLLILKCKCVSEEFHLLRSHVHEQRARPLAPSPPFVRASRRLRLSPAPHMACRLPLPMPQCHSRLERMHLNIPLTSTVPATQPRPQLSH